MGPDERFFIEYIGRQSTSEADDGRRGPHEGCAENQSWDVTPEHAVQHYLQLRASYTPPDGAIQPGTNESGEGSNPARATTAMAAAMMPMQR